MITEIKIIKFLLADRKVCTIRETAKRIESDYKITHSAVKSLIKKGVLEGKKIGSSSQISLTTKLTKEVYEAEDERRKEIMKNEKLKTVGFWLDELKFPFIALVFGSYAKGTATKHSDIDMLMICDEGRKTRIEKKLSMTVPNVHLTMLTPEEFLDGLRNRTSTVQTETIKNHVILVNIEQYYGMIKDAGRIARL